jgi:hypothetical protein
MDAEEKKVAIDRALVEKFRGYAEALQSGLCTSGRQRDMEALANNLEELAAEIRKWAGLPGR